MIARHGVHRHYDIPLEDRAIFIGFLLLLTFPIHGYLFILAHELGHALAGMLVGVEIHEIELGVGRELFTFNLGSIRFVIRRVAVMGVTRGNVRDLRHGRIKRLIYIAGGPAADAAVLMIALMLVDGDPTPATPWLGSIIFIEAMFLLSDLTPRYVSLGDTRIGTDSQQIIELIRGDSWRSWTTAMYAIGEILIRYGARPEDRPYNFLRNRVPGLRLYDNAHKAFIGDRYSDFIEAVETILRDHDPTVAERGMLLDWLCNLVVINGLREYLPQADAWSLTALTLRPAMPTLTSTRGAILIEMGELDVGIAMLLPLIAGEHEEIDRTMSIAYLAKAHHRNGEHERALDYLDLATSLAPDNPVVMRIGREIAPERFG